MMHRPGTHRLPIRSRAALAVLVWVAALVSGGSVGADDNTVPGLAAIVGSEAIAYGDVESELDDYLVARPFLRRSPAASLDGLRRQILDLLIQRSLLKQEAMRQQITISPPEMLFKINSHIESYRKEGRDLRDEEDLYRFLLENEGMSRKDYREEVRRSILIEKLLWKEVYDRVEFISPGERRQYYHTNRELFQTPSEIRFRQIFLPRSEETLDAMRLIDEALDRGEDFGELAKRYSDSPIAQDGGLWVKKIDEIGSWPRPLPTVLKRLKAGQVERKIESSRGIHYIKMESIAFGEVQPFDDPVVQQRIESVIRRQRQDQRRDRFVQELKKRFIVKNFLGEATAKGAAQSAGSDPSESGAARTAQDAGTGSNEKGESGARGGGSGEGRERPVPPAGGVKDVSPDASRPPKRAGESGPAKKRPGTK